MRSPEVGDNQQDRPVPPAEEGGGGIVFQNPGAAQARRDLSPWESEQALPSTGTLSALLRGAVSLYNNLDDVRLPAVSPIEVLPPL